ncbi:MAG TPA: hypothetical protein VHE33_09165 [Acidobacteriaceae bacterium]|nr:hypothetical protein [Acidobacteriaceae bacterium]
MQSSTLQMDEPGCSRRWYHAIRTVKVAFFLLAATTALAAAQDLPPGTNLRPWETVAIRVPDKNDQMKMHEQQQQQKQTRFAAVNLERKRQIAEDTAKMVELANELKQEVDKTDKDTMSINVIRKADAIEKLAKSIKEKMKATAGSS